MHRLGLGEQTLQLGFQPRHRVPSDRIAQSSRPMNDLLSSALSCDRSGWCPCSRACRTTPGRPPGQFQVGQLGDPAHHRAAQVEHELGPQWLVGGAGAGAAGRSGRVAVVKAGRVEAGRTSRQPRSRRLLPRAPLPPAPPHDSPGTRPTQKAGRTSAARRRSPSATGPPWPREQRPQPQLDGQVGRLEPGHQVGRVQDLDADRGVERGQPVHDFGVVGVAAVDQADALGVGDPASSRNSSVVRVYLTTGNLRRKDASVIGPALVSIGHQ